jgi:outer membrane protein assembly factor BamD
MRQHVYGGLVALALLGGCSSRGEQDLASLASNSDQVIWEAGNKSLERRDYEGARQHFRRIIDGFPQSELGPSARIALADSYFKEGGVANYILAVPAYRDFLTLFPSHPKSDYAQFMTAEAYFAQRNSPDRDQTPTRNALQEYLRLLEIYPSTSYSEQARARISEARYSLARHDFLVGWFYQRTRQSCRAAIPRYQAVLDTFPDYRDTDEVLFRISECLGSSGRAPEALPLLDRLVTEYPQSRFVEPARTLHAALSQAAPAQAPPTTPGGGAEG